MSLAKSHSARGSQLRNSAFDAYKEAFNRCYPAAHVEVKRAGGAARGGEPKFNVVINGDRGDLPMTLWDLQEATRAFSYGAR